MAIRTANKVVVPDAASQSTTEETSAPAPAVASAPEPPAAVPQETPATPTPETKPEPEKVAPAPAVRQQAQAPVISDKKMVPLGSLKNFWNPNTVGGTFSRLVPAAGIIRTDSGIQLGSYVDVQVISTSDRWMLAPVADMSKDPESKKYCRASYDNQTIPDREGGEPMTFDQWIEEAAAIRRASGKPAYEEWKQSKYMDIYALVFHAEGKYNEIAQTIGVAQISVSSTAIKAFLNFFMQGQLRVMRGQIPPDKQHCIRIQAEARSNSNNQDYSALVPTMVPLEILEGFIQMPFDPIL